MKELVASLCDRYGMELGKPTFVPVEDLEMGFEKIVKIAISRGVCKRQDVITKLKAERKQSVQAMDVFLQVLTSIPGIENHDANALNQAIGSIEAIAKASKEYILQNTDLSADKAEIISRFFRDPNFYMSPKINRSEKQGHVNSMLKLADFIHDCLVRYTDIETRFSCYPGFQFKTVSDGLSADHPRSLDKFMELYDSLNSKTKPLLREMLVSNQLGSNTRPSLTCIIVDGLISIFTSDIANDSHLLFSFFT
ncbi:hypothetical protein CMV_027264 [Castanea mollissima]|uniref:Uncharacterized protein n=1 Tax=Castanea mollissima TaxID=60419 RepID=A0A8J4QIJ4_9ROSI|nr:hypothetical protein CMV_027264 [Castanea mollissima]